jgi:hypothetical protein
MQLVLAAVLLAGCNRYPESYPPPEQREPLSASELSDAKTLVNANDPDAESFFVREVGGLEGGQWRWTGAEPTFHFVLEKTGGLKFFMDFAVAGVTIKETGPVTVNISVNGRPLGERRFAEHGQFQFEAPVPEEWLVSGADTLVKVTVDPPWVSPTDGTKLGVIFSRAGFLEE